MNTYYTAKDIEEMAARGVKQLELGPGITLTDFARETAQQFNITLVTGNGQAARGPSPSPQSTSTRVSNKYNKPKGCQYAAQSFQVVNPQIAAPLNQSTEGTNANTVNRLIDLMGKVVKRGG